MQSDIRRKRLNTRIRKSPTLRLQNLSQVEALDDKALRMAEFFAIGRI
jgi:hypothetical protein